MADIQTPTTARKTEEFTASQRQLVRDSLFIHDNPFQPDKTYIVFDADAGDNDLHIITGSSNTYSITQGDGTQPEEYTDTGGTKTLNYATAGRYLITIEGTFNGISTDGVAPSAKNKYIGIIAGSNYPVNIPNNSFNGCTNLEFIKFDNVTSIGTYTFYNCSNLNYVNLSSVTTIGERSFYNCITLKYINIINCVALGNYTFYGCESIEIILIPNCTSIGQNSFENCYSLVIVNIRLTTTIGTNSFKNCYSLIDINIYSATTIGTDSFSGCSSLQTINARSVTLINSGAFTNCISLQNLKIKYTSGLTINLLAFNGVKISDLYAIGAANLTEAQTVETKLTTAGMTQLNGYRLLY